MTTAGNEPKPHTRARKIITGLLCLAISVAAWMPCMHLVFRPSLDDYLAATGISPRARALAARHISMWSTPEDMQAELMLMRSGNPEWDFMGRTFLVLSLANMALREPEQIDGYLPLMDRIIDDTLRLEAEHGVHYFLMDYSTFGSFRASDGRSLFEDGEIALMLAARCMVEKDEQYMQILRERSEIMAGYMQKSRILCGESYPDECWMFCNSIALVAMRMTDLLEGTDQYSEFVKSWLEIARTELIDDKSGLMYSSFNVAGAPMDGPEGSSIWMVAHCLQVLDPDFAADQYRRAKKVLAKDALGFGYAREWPASWRGPVDVDSGPIVPVLEISAGSSGMALIAAAAFDDRDYLSALITSLNFGGFPQRKRGSLKYCASNQVGDAAMLYAFVQGPLWELILGAAEPGRSSLQTAQGGGISVAGMPASASLRLGLASLQGIAGYVEHDWSE